ncbi:MAG: hypothetical protein NC831_08805, partial [Candidatus Omnitrophica bacterium]|nr:hypothetical protein [Candidatus Omnitrophota bacterium]
LPRPLFKKEGRKNFPLFQRGMAGGFWKWTTTGKSPPTLQKRGELKKIEGGFYGFDIAPYLK